MRWLRSRPAGLLICLLPLAACRDAPAPEAASRPTDIKLPREVEVVDGFIPRNATLAGLLETHRLGAGLAHQIVDVARGVFDPRRLRAGQPYRLTVSLEGGFRQFDYEIDRDRFLRVTSLDGPVPLAFKAEILRFPKRTESVGVAGAIDRTAPSLVAALDRVGEDVNLALALAGVFQAQVDFNSDLRQGDRFQVLVDKEFREDRFSGYGAIAAAELVNAGRRMLAFRFVKPDGQAGYFDEQGNSVRRFFLRSPLQFTPRITSRFSRSRMHPILGVARAHLGVDYAAPTGTPVLAVADGTVVSATSDRTNGRMVRLRHTNGYQTYYLHLSAFAHGIRAGARVAQGQVIGRSGATGLATGPHLDYRLSRNGTFVDPLAEHRRLPPGDPIPDELRLAFETARDEALQRMRLPAVAATQVAGALDGALGPPASSAY